MLRDYQSALAFLYDNLPMFQRIGSAALRHDLTNTLKLCAILGEPQQSFRTIHIAGTNGKGSSSHMLASVLAEAGYTTGLYTSPHLRSFTERIRINGEEISKDFVVDFVNRISPYINDIKPSFFEITVVMAFDYFKRAGVDVAVIETGLGGRLDSTNVITPVLSLITNIGWDHKDILGNTLELIAYEKAGIIKQDIPVVVSERQSDLEDIFVETAKRLHAPITFASDRYRTEQHIINGEVSIDIFDDEKIIFDKLVLPLQGFYQRKNVLGVLQSLDILKKSDLLINDQHIRSGLMNVVSNTGLKGRWQILGKSPLVVCDTGHNVDGIREVVIQIQSQIFEQLYIVVGMVKDKDIANVLEILPKEATYFFCQATIPRAMDATLLAAQAKAAGLNGTVVADVNDAVRAAREKANANDMIFIGGSTFVVAEIDNL